MSTASLSPSYAVVRNALLATVLVTSGLWAIPSAACSNVILRLDQANPDPAVVSARTLDFSNVDDRLFSPLMRAYERLHSWQSGYGPHKPQKGKAWTNRYGFIGADAGEYLSEILIGGGPYNLDGLNEHGLSAAFLWLSGSQYPDFTGGPRQLLWIDVVNYILGNFKTIAEVESAFRDPGNSDYVKVGGLGKLSDFMPLHVIVHDNTGKSLLIEWIDGEQKIYSGDVVDSIGVLTNEPEYPWQVENLKIYKGAKPRTEMMPIPGDSSPESRFVKLFKLRQYARFLNSEGGRRDAVQIATHIINNVDIPAGTDNVAVFPNDYTGPTFIRDHKQLKFYFKGQNNQSMRVIDLHQIDFSQADLWKKAIFADPKQGEPFYDQYSLAQDVTELLTTQ